MVTKRKRCILLAKRTWLNSINIGYKNWYAKNPGTESAITRNKEDILPNAEKWRLKKFVVKKISIAVIKITDEAIVKKKRFFRSWILLNIPLDPT